MRCWPRCRTTARSGARGCPVTARPRLHRRPSPSPSVGPARATECAERAALDAERAAALRRGDLTAFVDAWEALPLFATQRALPSAVQAQQRAARLVHDALALAWAFEVAGLACMPDLRPAVAASRQPLVSPRWARRSSARPGCAAAAYPAPATTCCWKRRRLWQHRWLT